MQESTLRHRKDPSTSALLGNSFTQWRAVSALSPFTDFYWPDLRSEVNPLLQQQDLLRRNLQELHSLMDKLQTDILEEPFHTSEQPAVSYYLQKEGGLTLDTQGFSPEELGRKQSAGRRRKRRRTGKAADLTDARSSLRSQTCLKGPTLKPSPAA
ncbi:hypothetical protein KUCAC02_009115 [Chaenocephalus aceratus]|uniref:Uncharacterized protein n=1 Tax=Chaenocephalus aceratus TaxID=36190 RepID=A0ACB9WSU2_CHAAC|nr:hypothetical protein KUCAC02_009115 [Chaenocephalus aceratus]